MCSEVVFRTSSREDLQEKVFKRRSSSWHKRNEVEERHSTTASSKRVEENVFLRTCVLRSASERLQEKVFKISDMKMNDYYIRARRWDQYVHVYR